MQATKRGSMALDEGDLREVDRVLLDYLAEGRVTPVYARERVIDDGIRESITAQYCQQRLHRLTEHDHAQNLYDVGLYELVEDPRDDED